MDELASRAEELDRVDPLAWARDRFVVPDDFDAPLEDELLAAFESD